jgi:hypothetical protein
MIAKKGWGNPAFFLVFAVLFLCLANLSARQLDTFLIKPVADTPLYLPESKYVKLVTLGFDNAASDLIWFQTINYFGKQYKANSDFKWLYLMCDLVSSLDARQKHVYEFCGTLLSWMAKQPELSNQILTKGIAAMPQWWRLYYLRSFNNWYFLENMEVAQADLSHASRLPEAPLFLTKIASRMMIAGNNPQLAVDYLRDLIRNTRDKNVASALTERLKLAEQALVEFQSGNKIEFTGKTAKTGVLKEQFQD